MNEDNSATESSNNERFEVTEITVDPKQASLRLDKFLHAKLQSSRNRIQNAIKDGAVTVDDKPVKANHKIRPGEVIKLVLPKPFSESAGILPENIPLDIRYEDDDILILHKPPGLVVHPGIGNWSGTLVNGLAYHFGDDLPTLEGNPENRIGLVHRIDKDTSGLLVIAKTDDAMTHLAKQFFDHTIDRTYYALVWGDLEEDKGTITGHIGRDYRNPKTYTVYDEEEDTGKWAVTHYEVVERLYYATLVRCKLETGRTHQIRVHFRHLGHPLFSDATYGGDKILKGTIYTKYKQYVHKIFKALPRQGLHAHSLGFEHPRTKERMFFEAPLPDDFRTAVELWRSYVSQRQMGNKNMP